MQTSLACHPCLASSQSRPLVRRNLTGKINVDRLQPISSRIPLRTCGYQQKRQTAFRGGLVKCSAATATFPSSETPDQGEEFQLIHGWRSDNVKNDIFGALTAAVVALPLALAFGVASGAGALAGLYGAIFVGFFAALFGGTPAQVSGPTGPMTVVTAALITRYAGQPVIAFSVVALSGLLQILMGIFKLGGFVRLVPISVTSGFMSGIGFIIICTQCLALLGHAPGANALAGLSALPAAVADPNLQALLLGAISVCCCAFTPKKIAKVLPGSLLALVVGTATSIIFKFNVPMLGAIPTGIPKLLIPTFPPHLLAGMFGSAAILAMLGAIDSLLTSLVADQITGTYHNSDRELIGQGIGNTVSGLFGGVAGAGATMRTMVNVRAGGRTPLSGALHSVILLAVVLGLGRWAAHIPLGVLAGILMKCGIDIIDRDYIARVPRLPISSTIIMAVTLGMTVFVDLIAAVAVGVVMASLVLVKKMADQTVEDCHTITGSKPALATAELGSEAAELLLKCGGKVVVYKLKGTVMFNGANGVIRKVLPTLENYSAELLDLTEVDILDDTAALALEQIIDRATELGRPIVICGADEKQKALLDQLQISAKSPLSPSISRVEGLTAISKFLKEGKFA